MRAGNIVGGRAAYRDRLLIARSLSTATPSSTNALRDLSVALTKVGTAAVDANDLPAALTAYEESLSVTRAVYAGVSTDDLAYLTDLGGDTSRLGDIAARMGQVGKAQAAFDEALPLLRRATASSSATAIGQSELAETLVRIATHNLRGATWSDVVVQGRLMADRGQLSAADALKLRAAEARITTKSRP